LSDPDGAEARWLRLECDPADSELTADRLWALGAIAIGEEPGVLTAGFPDRESAAAATSQLGGRWGVSSGADDGDWRSAWRPHARPVLVGPFLIRTVERGAGSTARAAIGSPPASGSNRSAGPVGARPPEPDSIVLDIDPGHSFGSGHHPTTRQCLAEVAQLAGPGRSVLDVGSGSGVLSVAAARLGAGRVVALDLDHRASVATRDNGAANGVDLLVLTAGPAALRASFDLVVANLGGALAPIALADTLTGLVAPGGALVVAGLLAPGSGVGLDPAVDQPRQVRAALAGLEAEGRRQDDGWVALRMRRR